MWARTRTSLCFKRSAGAEEQCEPRKHLGVRFRLATTRSPAEAFDRVADFSRIAEWDPFVRRSDLVAGKRLEVGSRYRLMTRGGLTLEYEIAEVLPPNRIVYHGGTRQVTSTDTISVERGDDETVVVVESLVRFTGWTRLFSPLVMLGLRVGGRFVSLPAMERRLRP